MYSARSVLGVIRRYLDQFLALHEPRPSCWSKEAVTPSLRQEALCAGYRLPFATPSTPSF